MWLSCHRVKRTLVGPQVQFRLTDNHLSFIILPSDTTRSHPRLHEIIRQTRSDSVWWCRGQPTGSLLITSTSSCAPWTSSTSSPPSHLSSSSLRSALPIFARTQPTFPSRAIPSLPQLAFNNVSCPATFQPTPPSLFLPRINCSSDTNNCADRQLQGRTSSSSSGERALGLACRARFLEKYRVHASTLCHHSPARDRNRPAAPHPPGTTHHPSPTSSHLPPPTPTLPTTPFLVTLHGRFLPVADLPSRHKLIPKPRVAHLLRSLDGQAAQSSGE